jgi:hypothetical protein
MSVWNLGGLWLFFLVLAYTLPLLVAWLRKHHNADAIGVLNLLLGWTLIGWVVSLVWALTEVKKKGDTAPAAAPALPEAATKQCPFCAERILAAAVLCKHCGSKLVEPGA